MILLDGKKLRNLMADSLKSAVAEYLQENTAPQPKLAIVQVGDLPVSKAYINQKKLFAERIGAKVLHKIHPDKVSETELIEEIKKLNKNKSVHGIIVQLPIPDELDKQKIIDTIDPIKDVDGLTATNIKRLWTNDERTVLPATALGVISLLQHYDIEIEGKKAVVVGRSTLVGKPIALALLRENATVTICHRLTKNLEEETRRADILVAAAGSEHLITKDHVKAGQVIIDVGINFTKEEHMVGDVDFEAVKDIVAAISPVPGGVGPMTVSSLFHNLVEAWKTQN